MTDQTYTQDAAADAVPDSVLDKIKKLMALAEGASHDDPIHRRNEAAAALAKAQSLLQEYNLDISAINNHRTDGDLGTIQDKAFAFESKSKSKYGPNRTRTDQTWVETIAQAVARGSFCKVIVNRYDIMFVGRTRNVDAAMYMFANVCSQVGQLALEAVREFNAEQKAKRAKWGIDAPLYVGNKGAANYTVFRNSWLLGASSTIKSRLDAQRADFEKMQRSTRPTDGSAPVVRTGLEVVLAADSEVDDYIDEKFHGGRDRRYREYRARMAAEQAAYDADRAAHPEKYRQVEIVDDRTPEQRARDAKRQAAENAAYAKREQRRREAADRREQKYFREHGYHTWERPGRSGPQMNYGAYNQGIDAGQRVSLDAGRVERGERKQLKGE